MSSLYQYIDKWDGQQLFIYITIAIVLLWIFQKYNLGVNILIGLLVIWFIISYLNNRTIEKKDSITDVLDEKKSKIVPKAERALQHDDIVDFLFSVQDLYSYNPPQYIEMVNSIERFFQTYDLVITDNKVASVKFGVMYDLKRDALNALQSIIFELPEFGQLLKRLQDGGKQLDAILTKYLDHISYLIDNNIYLHGYNTETQVIDYGAKPFNQYSDIFLPYSYQIY